MKLFLLALLGTLSGMAGAQTSAIRVFITPQASLADSSASPTASKLQQENSLRKACPSIVITEDQAAADYTVAWENKTWNQTSWGGHQNDFVIYNRDKEVVGSGATHHTANAGKDICKLLTKKTK
jgi:hypothetical protein